MPGGGGISYKSYSFDDAMDQIGFGRYQLQVFAFNILITGADAMEMTLLAFIGPAIRCEWDLEPGDDSIVGVAVFLGMFFGTLFWGSLADRIGRKPTIIVACFFTFLAGSITAVSNNLATLCVCRLFSGFGLANAVGSDYYMEHLPFKNRGFYFQFHAFGWVFGAITTCILAWCVFASLGWRWLVFLNTVPLLVTALVMIFFAEETPKRLPKP